MKQAELPIPIARLALNLAPAPALDRAVQIIMAKMAERHPRLFKNLARLDPATILIEPTDIPHKFLLAIGVQPATLRVVEGSETTSPKASIKGSLASLIDMLEARSDGDTLFFSRRLIITGDTSVIVGLRNTLDREEIHLIDDISSLGGPFAKPASTALVVLGRLMQKAKERVSAFHDELHKAAAETKI